MKSRRPTVVFFLAYLSSLSINVTGFYFQPRIISLGTSHDLVMEKIMSLQCNKMQFVERNQPPSFAILSFLKNKFHSFQSIFVTSLNISIWKATVSFLAALFLMVSSAGAVPSGSRAGGSSFGSSSSSSGWSSTSSSASTTRSYYHSSPTRMHSSYYSMTADDNILYYISIAAMVGLYVRGKSVSNPSLIKITVCLDADWNDGDNIMNQLASLSSQPPLTLLTGGDTVSLSSTTLSSKEKYLSQLLQGTAMSVVRSKNNWISASYKYKRFWLKDMDAIESTFQQWVVQERLKFDKEVMAITSVPYNYGSLNGRPTKAVVCIVAAISNFNCEVKKANSVVDVTSILKSIAEVALHQEGRSVAGVEVMWSPSVPSLTLHDENIIADYPGLIRL